MPEMRRVNEELALVLAGEYRREGRGYEEYKAALKEKVSRIGGLMLLMLSLVEISATNCL